MDYTLLIQMAVLYTSPTADVLLCFMLRGVFYLGDNPPKTLKEFKNYVRWMRKLNGAKGGRARVSKGLSSVDPERRKEISQNGVAARALRRLQRILGEI
jgi:hypothetical protein